MGLNWARTRLSTVSNVTSRYTQRFKTKSVICPCPMNKFETIVLFSLLSHNFPFSFNTRKYAFDILTES